MSTLLHVCCAPCLVRCLAGFASSGIDISAMRGFFYNPNIHPLIEFRRRVKALRVFSARNPFPVTINEGYGLLDFLSWHSASDAAFRPRFPGAAMAEGAESESESDAEAGRYAPPGRCRRCYARRLGEVALQAKREGHAAFMTTLQASRQQDHALLMEEGERAARENGLRYVYIDCRAAEPAEAAMRGLYKQSYCGCIFSEADRYAGTRLHLEIE